LPPEKIEIVRTELDRILASPLFRASRRCQILLRRIIELTLNTEIESLKERSLGVEVFGRPADYDTSQDPVVRATAAEIRKKLAQYYVDAGHVAETRIELPSGAYYAEFHFIDLKEAPEVPPRTAAPVPTPARSGKRRLIGLSAATLLAAVAGLILLNPNSAHSELDELWGPLIKAPGTVLVCVGLQAAYNARSAQAQDQIQGIVRPPPGTAIRPLKVDDLVLLRDRYIALDDALCLVRMTSLLDRYRKQYRIRAEQSTSFADLRDTPAVLIGAFDNPWTLRASGQLRYTFSKDSERDIGMVHDSQQPWNTQWKLTNYWPEWDIPLDYAIVTRMVDTTTDRPVIIAAGLTQYGTIGAGEFVTKPEYFTEAARRLPNNWQKKNLQIVLSVPVVNFISGRPRILATHVW